MLAYTPAALNVNFTARMTDLTIERFRPSERSAEILDLFSRANQPDFARVFERAYLPREQEGLRSWVALSGGQAVLHISVTPQTLTDGERTVRLGLLADLMADETQRNFWGPLKLARRMVADVRADGKTDLLLTTYVPAAESVFKAAGFRPFVAMRRFVMPVFWAYRLLRRLGHRQRVPPVTALPWGREEPYGFLAELPSPGALRPAANRIHFATRMPRLGYPEGQWLLFGDPRQPEALALVSPKPMGELLIADLLWRSGDAPLSGYLAAIAGWAARHGHRRVSLTTIPGSRLAAAGIAAGFLLRPVEYGLLALPIRPLDQIAAPDEWSITPFALTSW